MLPRVSLAVGIAAGSTIALSTGLPSARLHAEEMAWTVNRYQSDVPDDADTVVLTYGIPETDAVAFEAVCGGRDGPEPRAVFWYDVVDLSENEDVVVTFSSGSFKDALPGKVYGRDAEVGVSGIQMTIDASAPLWSAMTTGTALSYGIAGGKRETLQLKDAAIAVGGFAAACKAGASSSPGDEARGAMCRQAISWRKPLALLWPPRSTTWRRDRRTVPPRARKRMPRLARTSARSVPKTPRRRQP